jgi:hypothetical protein
MSNTVNANVLRFGFFDGTTNWLHIVNIKILNDKNEDIAPFSVFTPTSTSVAYQTPGDLKKILTDNQETTFSHSELMPNTHIKVDFGKTVAVKQILIENRFNSIPNSERIKNAQFRLYDAADKIVYESDKITVGSKFYYLNMNSKVVNAGLPFIGDAMKAIADAQATMKDIIKKAADVKMEKDKKVADTLNAVLGAKVIADTKAAAIESIKPATEIRNVVVADAITTAIESGNTSPAAVIAAAKDAMTPITVIRDNLLEKTIGDTLQASTSNVSPVEVINAVKESVKESTEKRDQDLEKKITDIMSTPGVTTDDIVKAAEDSLSTSTEARDKNISNTLDSALPVVVPPPAEATHPVVYLVVGLVVVGVIYYIFKPAAPATAPGAPEP